MKCVKGKEIQVHKTPAGYYIGVWDEDGPRCRISGYYRTKEAAEKALENKTFYPDEGCCLCPGIWDCFDDGEEEVLASIWDDEEAFEAAYDAWEATWIDGPQP